MVYRVVYEGANPERIPRSRGRRIFLTGCFLCCFIWMVSAFWPEGRELLKILLVPGDPDATLEAAEVFAQELACGSPLKDAAGNFWQSVLARGYAG